MPIPPAENTIVTITNSDLTQVNGVYTLNSFVETVTAKSNTLLQQLIDEHSAEIQSRGAGAIVVGIVGAIATLLGAGVTVASMFAGSSANSTSSTTTAGIGTAQKRALTVKIRTNKWAALNIVVGIKQVAMILPPCDINVGLTVTVYNADATRLSLFSADYLPLAKSSDILNISHTLLNQGSGQPGVLKAETYCVENSYLYILDQSHIPTLLLSTNKDNYLDPQ